MKIKKPKRKPNLSQRFSSGNSVDVYIVETEPEIYNGTCEWRFFPPSKKDAEEYKRLVIPRLGREYEKLKIQKTAKLN